MSHVAIQPKYGESKMWALNINWWRYSRLGTLQTFSRHVRGFHCKFDSSELWKNNMRNNARKIMLGGFPANSLNVLMVLLFCLITFTHVFQNVQKTLSFSMVNTFQRTWKNQLTTEIIRLDQRISIKSWNSMKSMLSQGSFMPNFWKDHIKKKTVHCASTAV